MQGVLFWQLSQRGHTAELGHHVGPQVVGDHLVMLEVCTVNPHLCQQPIRARVRGQEDGILRAGVLQELKDSKVIH